MIKKGMLWIGMVFVLAMAGLASSRPLAADESYKEIPVTGWETRHGNWSETGQGFEAKNKTLGDSFFLSEQYVDGQQSFVFTCDVTFTGNIVGLVFGALDRTKPAYSWYCVNVDRAANTARGFYIRNDLVWNVSSSLQANEQDENQTCQLKVVYIAQGTMAFYVNDRLIGNYTTENFFGGHLGVMTSNANAVFSNIRYITFTPQKLEALKVRNTDWGKTLDPAAREQLAYVDYNITNLQIEPTFAEALTVSVAGKKATSGVSLDVPLVIGFNQLAIELEYMVGDMPIKIQQYLLVHRAQKESLLYHEVYRPQLHYSSQAELINDPNGLVYNATTGEYHLFYQSAPRTSVWSVNTTWYHAISKDLCHWEQVEPALFPDDLGICFSGSGGVDVNNTSGFFDESSDPNGRLVLFYTSVYGDTYYGMEKLSLAYSEDNGKTWKKYEGNPIISNGSDYKQEYIGGFRDPKLIWYEDDSYEQGGIWLLVVAGGRGRIFSSLDLVNWNLESEIIGVDKKSLYGECPDLFQISVEEDPTQTKWVFVAGHVEYGPNIYQTYAVVGSLGKNKKGKFVFTGEQEQQILFGGNAMYASQSFYNDKWGRRVQISWVREDTFVHSKDGDDSYRKDWRGLHSWPLELKLHQTADGYRLTCYPVEEMTSLRKKVLFETQNQTVQDTQTNLLAGVEGKYYEILAEIQLDTATEFGFRLRKGGPNETVVSYRTDTGLLCADGINGGEYKGTKADVTIQPGENNTLSLRIVVDSNVIDVYGNDGQESVFALTYPLLEHTEMEFYTIGGSVTVSSMTIYELESIWTNASESQQSAMLWWILGGAACLLVILGVGIVLFLRRKKRMSGLGPTAHNT